jgi:hypothetical protein
MTANKVCSMRISIICIGNGKQLHTRFKGEIEMDIVIYELLYKMGEKTN